MLMATAVSCKDFGGWELAHKSSYSDPVSGISGIQTKNNHKQYDNKDQIKA